MVAIAFSFGDHSAMEGERISPLKSYGEALKKCCFPGVPVMVVMCLAISCVSSMAICRAMYLHGKWVEYVSTGSLAYLSTLFCAVFTAFAPGFGCV